MAPPNSSSTVGDLPDDLEQIVGLDAWIAQLIRESGIGRLSALAGLSAPALASFLRERAAAALAPERIERQDWVGQARRLSGDVPDDEAVAKEPDSPSGRDEPVEGGRQQAGFSLFFDLVCDAAGRETWHTRVYHEESGSEIVLPGIEPGAWSDWILAQGLPGGDRLDPPPASSSADYPAQHQLLVRIVDAHVAGPRSADVRLQPLSVEVRLEVIGLAELERALGQTLLSSVVGAR